jgi:sulfur-oxidizing protein SoxZ
MAATKLKITAFEHYSELKILINHPMENGRNRDVNGQLIPAHFIQELQIVRNQSLLINLQLGPSVSKHPLLVFHLEKLQSGEKIGVSWIDNQSQSDSVEQIIA